MKKRNNIFFITHEYQFLKNLQVVKLVLKTNFVYCFPGTTLPLANWGIPLFYKVSFV